MMPEQEKTVADAAREGFYGKADTPEAGPGNVSRRKLVCPICSGPLELAYSPNWDGKPKWMLSHMACISTPVIHSDSAEEVLQTFLKYGLNKTG